MLKTLGLLEDAITSQRWQNTIKEIWKCSLRCGKQGCPPAWAVQEPENSCIKTVARIQAHLKTMFKKEKWDRQDSLSGMLAPLADYLSLIPGTHKWKENTDSHAFPWPPYAHHGKHMPWHMQTRTHTCARTHARTHRIFKECNFKTTFFKLKRWKIPFFMYVGMYLLTSFYKIKKQNSICVK